jgi:aldehyde:ferredoxin oxidoreductase
MMLPSDQVVLIVDLTPGQTSTEHMWGAEVAKFIGGRGIAAKLLCERLMPRTDPLGPSSLLIFQPRGAD